MTDFDIIERIQSLVGGKVWESNYPSKFERCPNAKPSWRWAVSSHEEIRSLISAVYKHLGVRRREKCDAILNYIERKRIAQKP